MSKTPEQIREYFINNYGIEVPIEKCTTYLTAYNTIARLTTVNMVRVVNRKLLEEVAGSEMEFDEASNKGEKIDNHIIKSYYFRYFLKIADRDKALNAKENNEINNEGQIESVQEPEMEESENFDDNPSENQAELILKKKRIIQILDNIGLEAQEEFFEQFGELTLEKLNNMSEVEFLTYILEEKKIICIDVKKGEQSKLRMMLNKIPTRCRDNLVNYFFIGVENDSLRGFDDEDTFISQLRAMGVYVINIEDSVLAIENIKNLERVIRTHPGKIEVCFGERFDLKGSLDNRKNATKFINKVKSEIEKQEIEDDVDWDTPLIIDELDQENKEPILIETQQENQEPIIPQPPQENIPPQMPQTSNNNPIITPPITPPQNKYTRDVITLNGQNIENDKAVMEDLLKQNYKDFGRSAIIRNFEQYIGNSGRISRYTSNNSVHAYENDKEPNKALRVLNARYIENVLKNAENIEYNFDMNPKARRLGEAIISLYSTMKADGVKENEITDKINDALTNLITNGDFNGFNGLKDVPENANIQSIASRNVFNRSDLVRKRRELEYLSSKDVVDIMVSTELDTIIMKESELAEAENREPDIRKSEIEVLEDQYKKNNDNTQIGTYRRMQALKHGDKNTELANAKAQKTQLLMYATQHRNDFVPALQIPETINNQNQSRVVEEAIKESIVDFIKLKGEIENVRKKITDKKIKNESVIEDEKMLKNLLNIYFVMYSNEDSKKLFSTYIAINETIKSHEKENAKSTENER